MCIVVVINDNVCICMYPLLGWLMVGKPGEPGVTYEHNHIHQLVKSRSKEQRLGIVLEGQGRKDYMFENLQVR